MDNEKCKEFDNVMDNVCVLIGQTSKLCIAGCEEFRSHGCWPTIPLTNTQLTGKMMRMIKEHKDMCDLYCSDPKVNSYSTLFDNYDKSKTWEEVNDTMDDKKCDEFLDLLRQICLIDRKTCTLARKEFKSYGCDLRSKFFKEIASTKIE